MPQLENGYTQIANEILEKLATTKMNGTQFRILLIVLRSTYGWKKKEHELSETFLSNATGIHKQQIKRELKNMIEEGILIEVKPPTFNTARVIKFNKYYEVAKKVPGNELDTPTGSELDTSAGSELDTQKRNTKNNINKVEIESFFSECWELYPNKKGKGKISSTVKEKRYKMGDEFKRCIQRYTKEVKGKEKEYIQHGSTFWNSGYLDYTDENSCDSVKDAKDLPEFVPKFKMFDRDA